jgi:hypothetical protein
VNLNKNISFRVISWNNLKAFGDKIRKYEKEKGIGKKKKQKKLKKK